MMRTSPKLALLMAIVLTIAPNYSTMSAAAQGKTCGDVVGQFNDATQAFIKEADQRNIGYIHNELFSGYGDTLSTALDSPHFDDIKERWDAVQETREKLNDVWLCLAPGSSCATTAKDKLTGKAKEWFDGLTDSLGLNGVRDKVLEAMNLIQSYTDRVLKISTDTMTAMQQCTSPMPGQPRLTLESVPPALAVDENGLPQVAEPPSKPVEEGGGYGGTLALVGAAGAAAYGASALGLFGPKCAADAPNNYHSTCESQGRNTSSCIALQTEYRAWCDCLGRNFSYTGGCTGNK